MVTVSSRLENYENRSLGLDPADRAIMADDLTDLEEHLLSSQELVKIRVKVCLFTYVYIRICTNAP